MAFIKPLAPVLLQKNSQAQEVSHQDHLSENVQLLAIPSAYFCVPLGYAKQIVERFVLAAAKGKAAYDFPQDRTVTRLAVEAAISQQRIVCCHVPSCDKSQNDADYGSGPTLVRR